MIAVFEEYQMHESKQISVHLFIQLCFFFGSYEERRNTTSPMGDPFVLLPRTPCCPFVLASIFSQWFFQPITQQNSYLTCTRVKIYVMRKIHTKQRMSLLNYIVLSPDYETTKGPDLLCLDQCPGVLAQCLCHSRENTYFSSKKCILNRNIHCKKLYLMLINYCNFLFKVFSSIILVIITFKKS